MHNKKGIFNFVDKFKSLDVFTKPLEDFQEKTLYGGFVTIVCWLIILYVTLSECYDYMKISWKEEIFVDITSTSKLQMNLDLVVPRISCAYLSVDAVDSTGDQHLQIEYNIYKSRLNSKGEIIDEPQKDSFLRTNKTITQSVTDPTDEKNITCGSCYGAETNTLMCCNTCADVKEAYRKKGWNFIPEQFSQCVDEGQISKNPDAFKEGCHIFGRIEVNRVGGSFHIAPGRSFSINYIHVHDVHPYSSDMFNTTHTIRHLYFGKKIKTIPKDGIQVTPLNNHTGFAKDGGMMFHYYIKLIPTLIQRTNGLILHTNQFSVTTFSKKYVAGSGDSSMPGIFFSYELSPLMVKRTEEYKSIGHLVTTILSNISGIYIAALLIDSLLHRIVKYVKQVEIGKQN